MAHKCDGTVYHVAVSGSWSHGVHSQEAEGEEDAAAPPTVSKTPAMMPPAFRVGFPFSFKAFWMHRHWHVQSYLLEESASIQVAN